jgi:branched-chain amino acid transport system substrate-binding protein
MLVLAAATSRVTIAPGTAGYRAALRTALATTREVVGTHAVYNYSEDGRYGTDERSRVLVRLDQGSWNLIR